MKLVHCSVCVYKWVFQVVHSNKLSQLPTPLYGQLHAETNYLLSGSQKRTKYVPNEPVNESKSFIRQVSGHDA